MSNSSLLDNPLLKVSRTVAACSRCRRAKIKCDGKLPACSACERVGKAGTCSGATDEFAKGKERSYVACLESYCENLEKQVTSLREHQKTLLVDGPGVALESSITSGSGSLAQNHGKEVSDIDDLVGDFGFLSVHATSRDFHGVTSSTSFASLLLSVSLVGSLPPPPSQSLPPRYEAVPLLEYYFDNFFVQLPFFFETSLWTSVDAVYQSGGRFAKPFDNWILRMLLAISLASMAHGYADENYQRALSLVGDAFRFAEDVLHPGSITGIQSILLLAQYSLVDPSHFRAWYLVGMAVRVMVDLGIHHEPAPEVVSDVDRLEIRRRVFYSIYNLDRAVSSALGRTFSFSDGSVHVALPKSPSSTLSGSSPAKKTHAFLRNIEPMLHITKVRQILSASYQEMHYNGREPSAQPLPWIWTLCWKVREWYDTSSSGTPCSLSTLYRLEMLYTMTVILSPSHRYPEPCAFNKVLLFEHSMSYVYELHDAMEKPDLVPFITFIDMQRVYQVGRQIVELLTQDFDLLLSTSVPAPPHESPGTPPPLHSKDRIACHARSIKCIADIRGLLHYCMEKWDISDLLEQFERASAHIQRQLAQTPVAYLEERGAYATESSTTLSARYAYPPFSGG